VIHTVGPIYRGGDQGEAELLARCHRASIRLADELGLSSLAFPAISTGIYGYPLDQAAPVALQAVAESLPECSSVELARFVLFEEEAFEAFRRAARELLGPEN
jgi:O-acetyl-ADP-ribose deacetylase (regulator of RNase III)